MPTAKPFPCEREQGRGSALRCQRRVQTMNGRNPGMTKCMPGRSPNAPMARVERLTSGRRCVVFCGELSMRVYPLRRRRRFSTHPIHPIRRRGGALFDCASPDLSGECDAG